MSNIKQPHFCPDKPKTTADLFRERGWGVGTKVYDTREKHPHWWEVVALGNHAVFLRDHLGDEQSFRTCGETIALYTPTPPIPTREEWEELWAALEALRNVRDFSPENHSGYAMKAVRVAQEADRHAAKLNGGKS